MTKEKSGEVVFDENKLRAHATIVMDTLAAAVECLDDSSQLTILLVDIGERHAHYGVRSEMIPVSIRASNPFNFYFPVPFDGQGFRCPRHRSLDRRPICVRCASSTLQVRVCYDLAALVTILPPC